MAVQGPDKQNQVFCDKCFSMVPKGSEYCPHCHAPLSKTRGADSTDPSVYPKLAQANLLRMRRQYKEAEDLCLRILHDYPHNLSTNTLLGDLAAERGDLDQAAEWYELALDIDPDSQSVADKLHQVQEKREHREVASTAEQLGLPTKRPKTALYAALGLMLLVILSVAGYLASQATQQADATPQSRVDRPVHIGPDDPEQPPKTTTTTATSTTGSTGGSEQDQKIAELIAKNAKDGACLTEAHYFRSIHELALYYFVPVDKKDREVGASLAVDALELTKDNPDYTVDQIVLNATDKGKELYSATVTRTAYDATRLPGWESAHKDVPTALQDAILSNETWPGQEKKDTTEHGATTTGEPEKTPAGTSSTPPSTGATTASGTTAAEPPKEPAKPTTTGG